MRRFWQFICIKSSIVFLTASCMLVGNPSAWAADARCAKGHAGGESARRPCYRLTSIHASRRSSCRKWSHAWAVDVCLRVLLRRAEDRSEKSTYPCGQHYEVPGVSTDDWYGQGTSTTSPPWPPFRANSSEWPAQVCLSMEHTNGLVSLY